MTHQLHQTTHHSREPLPNQDPQHHSTKTHRRICTQMLMHNNIAMWVTRSRFRLQLTYQIGWVNHRHKLRLQFNSRSSLVRPVDMTQLTSFHSMKLLDSQTKWLEFRTLAIRVTWAPWFRFTSVYRHLSNRSSCFKTIKIYKVKMRSKPKKYNLAEK